MIRRSNPMRRTRINPYRAKPRRGRLKGSDMEALRRACFERDSYRCQHITDGVRCNKLVRWERGFLDSGHMAHIRARSLGGHDTLDNVLTKCPYCHLILEHAQGGNGKIVPAKERAA